MQREQRLVLKASLSTIVPQTRNKMRKDIQEEVEKIVDARLLDGLCGKHSNDNTRESFQKLLREVADQSMLCRCCDLCAAGYAR